MERTIKNLNSYAKKIESLLVNTKKTSKTRYTKGYLQTRLETLNDYWAKYVKYHEECTESLSDEKLNDIQYSYTDIEDYYLELKTIICDSFDTLSAESTKQSTDTATQSKFRIPLPPVPIPKFSGNYSDWTSYRDIFVNLIHNDTHMSDIEKHHYLRSSLFGEAEQLLKHFALTSVNYTKAWETLQSRYDNKRIIVNTILNRFLSQRKLTSDNSLNIKQLLDTSKECLNSLENLGIQVNAWDAIVVHIITSKLDTESIKQWEQSLGASTSIPTFEMLQTHLETRFRTMEMVDMATKKENKKPNAQLLNKQTNIKTYTTTTNNYTKCTFCTQTHYIFNCKQFCKLEISQRQEFVKNNNLCFNCLVKGHTMNNCNSVSSCRKCGRRHHTLLHTDNKDNKVTSDINTAPSTSSCSSEPVVSLKVKTQNQVLLATSQIAVKTCNGNTYTLRALVDQGSQASFITERAVQMLGLSKIGVQGKVTGIGNTASLTTKYVVNLSFCSCLDDSQSFSTMAYVFKKITTLLPSEECSVETWPENLEFADPHFYKPGPIDVLLGAEIHANIMLEGLKRHNSLIALHSRLGWLISGKIPYTNSRPQHILVNHTKVEVDQLLRKFWELESYLPDHKALTPEDKNCEIYYETTHTRQTDGKYIVCLPFKDGFKERLGDSKSIAVKRLLQVENKFKKNIKFKEDYCKFMNQYLSDGHMELVPEKEINNKEKYYLPHHAVLREASVSTKLRVVFDGSAKPLIGNSLNEELLIGPSLQQDIRDLITRWRQHKYCLVADIQKMYRCIKCRESDTDYQRILWRENNNEPIKEYRLLTVTYGTSCAPYLAIRTLHQLCDDEIHSYPEVAPLLKTDVFVDDLLSGDATEEGAIHLQKQLTDIFLSGGFPLHKWCSNSELVLNNIPDNQKVYHSSVNIKIDNSVKALGITWEPNSDNFKLSIVFDNVINSNNLTKRKVLSTIASIFDPLGWLAPIVIVFKIFMQKLWLTGLGWDDELNSDLTKEWSKHVNNIAQHNTFFLPRWLSTSSSNTKVELHGFSDASCDAYAAVIYIRVFNSHEVTTQLIMSKTKVAPVKQISIPRLELCGAVLLANMLKNVQTSLKIKNDAVFAWTDSTIVLSWLQKHPNSWKTFIANRTAEILNLYSNHQWFHIKSSENPADCASRGLDSCDLVNHHLWWKGPEFLYKSDKSNFETFVVPDTCLEAKSKVCNLSVNSDHDCLSFLNKYSSLTKLIRVIAYCKRFITSCRSKLTTIYLSSHELKVAFNICIKLSQQYYFSSEISLLLKHKVIPKSSKLHSLCPVLDSDNILRVGGRLINANISLDMKTPVILSYQCNLSKLIVKNSHLNSLHGGIQLTLNLIRRKF